jgi:hypothetical protein
METVRKEPLSRDKELAIMTMTASLETAMESAGPEMQEWLNHPAVLAVQRSMAAANLDATVELMSRASPCGLEQGVRKQDSRQRAMLVAGWMRCLVRRCLHVGPGAPGLVVLLAPRIVTCKACIPDFMDLLKEHDRTGAHAGECDYCLKQGCIHFTQFNTVFMGCTFCGDCCDTCLADFGVDRVVKR